MQEYVCPRCSDVYNNDNDSDLWFIINAGYVKMGVCPNCNTPEEFKIIDSTWKAYRQSTVKGAKNA